MTITSLRWAAAFTAAFLVSAPASAIQAPVASPPTKALPALEANDLRRVTGALKNGRREIALDIVDAKWRIPGGDRDVVAFAERGGAAQMPGPFVRLRVGEPVHITLRNTLAKAVQVRGLGDRVRGDTAVRGEPAFMSRPPIEIAPGATREVEFTPTTAVTSFYFGRVVTDSTTAPIGPFETLAGAFVVDEKHAVVDPNERIFMVGIGAQATINGASWPYTERLKYTVGETQHWRVINISNEYHPMHLHGFYFTVTSRGDGQADTLLASPRELQVTEAVRPYTNMRLTWTPTRLGNWLFHCHLIVHSQGSPPDSATLAQRAASAGGGMDAMHDGMPMDDAMAGLIMGITVSAPRKGAGVASAKSAPSAPTRAARRIDVWTGTRPRVIDDSAGLGFVVQQGATIPKPDSITMPSSPLMLRRGERTEIVVHNRLTVPLSLHWHGIELESYYDGVGNWSGAPGNIRAPIAAGDSMHVFITPPRAGTFMYHIHGELGAELQQGLYGAFVVVEPDAPMNNPRDRLFLLASRGAAQNADAAINGRSIAPPERFTAGVPYRLRFMHISTNDVKKVRLLKDGKPVRWRPLAHDGAVLPTTLRVMREASMSTDVGQTFDYEWTPTENGIYILEVATSYLTFDGPPLQRVAFGVGPVSDEALRVAAHGAALPRAEVSQASLEKFYGAYGGSADDFISVGPGASGLSATRTVSGLESDPVRLLLLTDGTFVVADADSLAATRAGMARRYSMSTAALTAVGGSSPSRARLKSLTPPDSLVRRVVGAYDGGIQVDSNADGLVLKFPGAPPFPLIPISLTRFAFDGGGGLVRTEFIVEKGKMMLHIAGNDLVAGRIDGR